MMGVPYVVKPTRKPNLWRFYQARMTFNGEHVPVEKAPVVWTSREALIREIEREKGGIQLLTQCRFTDFPPDRALYRYTDSDGDWRYFFICREKEEN
jgi:hypothetical protein